MASTVYGISVDTPFALKAWAAEQKLGFPLLSDFNKYREVLGNAGNEPDYERLKKALAQLGK